MVVINILISNGYLGIILHFVQNLLQTDLVHEQRNLYFCKNFLIKNSMIKYIENIKHQANIGKSTMETEEHFKNGANLKSLTFILDAVVISVDLSFYYPDVHFNFNDGYIRIFDTGNKKLLASFRYKARTVGNLNDFCTLFIKD